MTSVLPSITFLRSSDIAQSGLARPHNRSLCLLWRRYPAWIGHYRRDVKGGPITVRSYRSYTFMALAPGRQKINLAAQASPWAYCGLFHHPAVARVGISADEPQRYDRTRSLNSSARGVCVAWHPCPPAFPVRGHPPGPQEASVTRQVSTVNERGAAVWAGLDLHRVSDNFWASNGYAYIAAVYCRGPGQFGAFAPPVGPVDTYDLIMTLSLPRNDVQRGGRDVGPCCRTEPTSDGRTRRERTELD